MDQGTYNYFIQSFILNARGKNIIRMMRMNMRMIRIMRISKRDKWR